MYEEDETDGLGGALSPFYAKYAQEEEKLRREQEARIQSRWHRGLQALQERRAGPGKTETIAQALLAFGQPTRGGGWAALGNAGNVLAQGIAARKNAELERAQQMRDLENAREEGLSELAQKYGQGRLEVLGKLATMKPATPQYLPLATGPNGETVNPLTFEPIPRGSKVMRDGTVILPSGMTTAAAGEEPSRKPVKVASMSEVTGLPLGALAELPDGSVVRNTAKGVEAASPKMSKTDNLTPGQQALDRAFGNDYAEWLNGGNVSTQTQLKALEQVQQQLAAGENLSGGAASLLPSALQKYVDPDRVSAQQAVEKAIQATLRATLGAQYTQREGEDLLARSWDPRLPPKENAKKLAATIADLKRRVEQKNKQIEYFDREGTLAGFSVGRPKPKTGGSGLSGKYTGGPKVTPPGAPKPKSAPVDLKKLSDEDLKRALGL